MSLGRDELKKCFKAGALPTQEHFYGLIDSMLHMEDEGFRKTPQHGLEVTSERGDEAALLTFFRKDESERPLWTLRQSGAGAQLNLSPVPDPSNARNTQPPALLTLDQAGCIGVAQEAPSHPLDVAGFIGSTGRTGTYFHVDAEKPPLPNGEWHVLADDLTRCVAFEVIASASGATGKGRHAVMHAFALNAYNPTLPVLGAYFDRLFNRKKRIKCHNAWFGQRCDRLELAWQTNKKNNGKEETYALMIRTLCDYGSGATIDVRVTQLWPVPEPAPTDPFAVPARADDTRTGKRGGKQRAAGRRG